MHVRSRIVHSGLAIGILLAAGLIASLLHAPDPILRATMSDPPLTNRDGFFVNFEEGPVHPMEILEDPNDPNFPELWVVNIPDASVSVFDISDPNSDPSLEAEVPVGLGPICLRHRPDSTEMWVVCQTSNAIFIIDETTKIVDGSIRLYDISPQTAGLFDATKLHEPTNLVFNTSGTRAYVALSTSNFILQINTTTRAPLFAAGEPIPFGSVFDPDGVGGVSPAFSKAEEPRAMVIDGTTLHVASFESGNGSIHVPTDPNNTLDADADKSAQRVRRGAIIPLWETDPERNPLFDPNGLNYSRVFPPDRDLISFDLSDEDGHADGNSVTDVAFRRGTINTGLAINEVSGSLYLANVDANNTVIGEQNFSTTQAIASHRISIIDLDGETDPNTLEQDGSFGARIFDLNDPDFRHESTPIDPDDPDDPNNVFFSFPTEVLVIDYEGPPNNVCFLLVACLREQQHGHRAGGE